MNDEGRLDKETVVRFERLLPGPIERVWDFLTISEHLTGWIGEGSIEPREGGAVNIGEGHIRGTVTRWKPPHLLTYTWNVFNPGDDESPYPETYVTFELKDHSDGVLLILTHRPIGEGFEAQTMMGWHTLLDMLAAVVRGVEPEPRDVMMERNRMRYGVERIKR